jgi:flagellar biosynthetic protein FliR
MSGQMMASLFDPSTNENSAVAAQLLYWVALALFLATGGHRLVMSGLLETYQTIPPGGGALPAELVPAMVAILRESFYLAIQAAAPIIAALLMSTLVVGLIGRTLPQLNIMVLGFGLNSMVMVAVMLVSLGGAVWIFQGQVEPALTSVISALRAP